MAEDQGGSTLRLWLLGTALAAFIGGLLLLALNGPAILALFLIGVAAFLAVGSAIVGSAEVKRHNATLATVLMGMFAAYLVGGVLLATRAVSPAISAFAPVRQVWHRMLSPAGSLGLSFWILGAIVFLLMAIGGSVLRGVDYWGCDSDTYPSMSAMSGTKKASTRLTTARALVGVVAVDPAKGLCTDEVMGRVWSVHSCPVQ